VQKGSGILGMDGHHLVDNLALHLESAFLFSYGSSPLSIFLLFSAQRVVSSPHLSFLRLHKNGTCYLGLSKFVWQGGQRIVYALFLYRWLWSFCAHIDFPFTAVWIRCWSDRGNVVYLTGMDLQV
jgi:hypothetical protein